MCERVMAKPSSLPFLRNFKCDRMNTRTPEAPYLLTFRTSIEVVEVEDL